jgi:site-specific recombinase XerD
MRVSCTGKITPRVSTSSNERATIDSWLRALAVVDDQAFVPKTQVDYRRTQLAYEQFVLDVSPSSEPWPVSPVFLRLFMVFKFYRNGRSAQSLQNYMTHIKAGNLDRGFNWFDISAPAWRTVRITMRALAKMNQHKTVRRKTPLTIARIRRMVSLLNPDLSKEDLEFVTMCWLCHNALLRSGEVVSLTFRNIRWSTDRRSLKIILFVSKANQTGPPEEVELVCWGGDSSAVKWMRRYFDENDLWDRPESEPLFPSFRSRQVFVDKVQRLVVQAGLEGDFAGHSFRSGGACDLWAENVPLAAIQRMGRWKSECIMLYLRDEKITAIKIAEAFRLAAERGFAFWGA